MGQMDAVNKLMRDMWADIERASMEREEKAAKLDPIKHKLSRVIRGGLRYKYYETKNGRGSQVRFCYSTKRNIAGYFLIWRETWTAKQGKRDQWDATTSKDSAIRAAKTMWEEFQKRA